MDIKNDSENVEVKGIDNEMRLPKARPRGYACVHGIDYVNNETPWGQSYRSCMLPWSKFCNFFLLAMDRNAHHILEQKHKQRTLVCCCVKLQYESKGFGTGERCRKSTQALRAR
eukprot:scaffold40145_cov18-Tisochrysis_lutea.AAC.3